MSDCRGPPLSNLEPQPQVKTTKMTKYIHSKSNRNRMELQTGISGISALGPYSTSSLQSKIFLITAYSLSTATSGALLRTILLNIDQYSGNILCNTIKTDSIDDTGSALPHSGTMYFWKTLQTYRNPSPNMFQIHHGTYKRHRLCQ
jgi:hypothetical protein